MARSESTVAWSRKNPDLVREHRRRYRERNRARIADLQWDWESRNLATYLCTHIRWRAKKCGIEFDLTPDDIVVGDVCPVIGQPFERVRGKHSMLSPTVDRIDPNKGYVRGNIQVISKLANTMKCNATPDQLRAFAAWVGRTYSQQQDEE